MTELLPSPLSMAIAGGVFIAAAVAIVFFLHILRIALIVGAIGGILLFASSVAYGYEKLGEDNIRPALEKALGELRDLAARSAQFEIEANVAQKKAVEATAAKNTALKKLAASVKKALDAQAKQIADAVVPPPVVVFVNATVADVNDSAFGPGAGDAAGAAATTPAPTTVRQWEEWSAEVASLYGECAAKVDGLHTYINGLHAAGQRAAGK